MIIVSKDELARGNDLHSRAILIDGCAPILIDLDCAPLWIDGGGTAAMATVALHDDTMLSTIRKIAGIYHQASTRDDVIIVHCVDDISRAKEEQKLGIILMFQSGGALDRNIENIALFHRLGVRSINLAYNVAEDGADGCMEPRNGGLTVFGKQVIAEMHRHGIVLDLSHTGYTATMEALEMASYPVIFSHSNAAAVYDHPRSIRDDQIEACAQTGGVIGINSHPVFVREGTTKPSIDDLLVHLTYLVDKAGIDHVGLGMDFSQKPGMQMPTARYERMLADGVWSTQTLPPPPWSYPVSDARQLSQLTEAMVKMGWADDDIQKVLGQNFMRVFSEVWSRDPRSPE